MANSAAASRYALERSIELLQGVDIVRAWTFTFPVPRRDWPGVARAWRLLYFRLRRLYGKDLPGVRVVEWHPGGHGWHIHFLVARYLPVDSVRAAAQAAGFGRVHVFKPDKDTWFPYFAKHWGKDMRQRARGMRKWACTGGYRGLLVREVGVSSTYSEWRAAYLAVRGRSKQRLKSRQEIRLRLLWVFGYLRDPIGKATWEDWLSSGERLTGQMPKVRYSVHPF